jgi:hypothetical protein
LVYADGVNLPGNNINAVKENTQILTDDSKEVGLKVKAEKMKYMLLSSHLNAEQNREIMIANMSFVNVDS